MKLVPAEHERPQRAQLQRSHCSDPLVNPKPNDSEFEKCCSMRIWSEVLLISGSLTLSSFCIPMATREYTKFQNVKLKLETNPKCFYSGPFWNGKFRERNHLWWGRELHKVSRISTTHSLTPRASLCVESLVFAIGWKSDEIEVRVKEASSILAWWSNHLKTLCALNRQKFWIVYWAVFGGNHKKCDVSSALLQVETGRISDP